MAKVGKDLDSTLGFKQKRANDFIWCSPKLLAFVLVVFADFLSKLSEMSKEIEKLREYFI